LAEAGLIESRLSRQDIQLSGDEDDDPFYFSPGRYVLSEFGYLICGYIFCTLCSCTVIHDYFN